MKKTFYILLGFTFCVTMPALAESYRANNAHMMIGAPRQIVTATAQY